MLIALLIPAYQPDETLITVLNDVKRLSAADPVLNKHELVYVVVDDASTKKVATDTFLKLANLYPDITILRRHKNGGQGAALKHGIKWLLENKPQLGWLVTGDADGQHLPEDIIKIMRAGIDDPNKSPILGMRNFSASVPLRSRLGNIMTSYLIKFFYGHNITDTQTGLRGFPPRMLKTMLGISANRFQFNSEVLLALLKNEEIRNVEIQTVYEPGNPSSHFRPLIDSLQIWAVLLRYVGVIALVAILEFANFFALLGAGFSISYAILLSKIISVLICFLFLRDFVFKTKGNIIKQALGFLTIVALNMIILRMFIFTLHETYGISLLLSSMTSFSIMFIFNFIVQRQLIFHRKHSNA